MIDLSIRYNKAIPRYTSYPTVPHWKLKSPEQTDWLDEVKSVYFSQADKSISLYIHLPFCESLCTYCGCNKRITKNHEVEGQYIEALLSEWDIYVNALGEKPIIRNIHLGGGTPTFFLQKNLTFFYLPFWKKEKFILNEPSVLKGIPITPLMSN